MNGRGPRPPTTLGRSGKENDPISVSSFDYRFSVCIATWNSRADIGLCLESLREAGGGRSFEVIVVDNRSRDGTPQFIRREFPWVRLDLPPYNLGFAGANNRALTAARGREVFLLNPDTVVHPGALDRLVEFLDARPRCGMVGPQLRYPDGSLQWSCRRFPNFGAGLFRNTPLGKLFPGNRFTTAYLMDDWDHSSPRRVDWLSGACCLVRREVLDSVGLLDDRFFLYCEDVDWCYRMRQAGWERWYVPTAVVTHRVGGSSDQRMVGALVQFHSSMIHFYRKHYGTGTLALVRPVAVTAILLRGAVTIGSLLVRRGGEHLRARLDSR